MHNQISRKRRGEPALTLDEGKYLVYPVDVAGVNRETLQYESWVEYEVFQLRTDEFGACYMAPCDVPEWALLAIRELDRARP